MSAYYYRFFLLLLFSLAYSVDYGQNSRTDSLIFRSDQILKNIKEASADSSKLKLLAEIIDINMDSRPALVQSWLTQGIDIAAKNNLPDKQLAFKLKELRLLNIQGQFLETIKKGNELETLLNKSGSPIQKAAYLLSMGNAQQRTGNYDQAASLFTQAIDLCATNKIHDIEVRAAMNLGNLYQFLNRYDEMLQHLQRTLVKAEKYQLAEDIPMIKFNISNAEAHLNNFGKAITYLLEVLPYYQKTNNQYALGLAYANLSWCYFKSQNRDLALQYAYQSYAIRTLLRDEAGLAHVELNLGKIYLENVQYDSSLKYAGSSLKKSIELKLMTDIRDNYETLYLVHERKGDFAAANKYLHSFYGYKDSISLQERDKTLEKEFAKYRSAANNTLNSDLQNIKFKEKIYQALLLLLMLLVGYLLFRSFLKRKKAAYKAYHHPVIIGENNIESSNDASEEKRSLLKEMEELKLENEKLLREFNTQKSTDISELRDMISSNKLHSDVYWNEFLLLFSKVYPSFFEKMKLEYPGLNQNELRIAALIKLNHSITDMARALNITVDSARKARYRLYKKAGLSNDQELIDKVMVL